MKFASLKAGGRDGSLLLVSRDLMRAVSAKSLVPTLREAIENWAVVEPDLRKLYGRLNSGDAGEQFHVASGELAAPLPRAFQWCDGSAYLHHAELVRKARNAEIPQSLYHDPLIYQGGSDHFLGPHDAIKVSDENWGVDLEAELAVVTDDVPMGVSADAARAHIKLLMLVNDVSLRNLVPSEVAKGFGFFLSKPPTAFSPVAVTPDELLDAWDGGKVGLPLLSYVNGRLLGRPNAGVDLNFDFPRVISHAATSRELRAGTIVGLGTVSNRDLSTGSSCLQEKRMLEKLEMGEMVTPLLKFGDRVRIEMLDASGASIFGAIEQEVTSA
jgi:fumarylacetoacetate (FAA) hydrolase